MLRRISQVMHGAEATILPPSATVHAAAVAMAHQRQCVVLVMAAGRLDGILTEQDVVRRVVAERRDPATVTVGEVMTPRPDTIDQSALALTGLQMMEDGHYRHLPVVYGGHVIGMVSRLDFDGEEKAELESQRHFQETIW